MKPKAIRICCCLGSEPDVSQQKQIHEGGSVQLLLKFCSALFQFGSALLQRSGSVGSDRVLGRRRLPVVLPGLPGVGPAAGSWPRPVLTRRERGSAVCFCSGSESVSQLL